MTHHLGNIGQASGFQGVKRSKSMQEQIDELRRAGASPEAIVAAMKEAGAGGEAIAKAMKAAGYSIGAIVGALQDQGYTLQSTMSMLKKAGFSGKEVAKHLSEIVLFEPKPGRWLRPEEIGKLLHAGGFEPKEIVEGLVAIKVPDQKIVDILVDLKIHKDEIIKAMKKAGYADNFIRQALERATGRPVDTWPVGKYSLRERAGL